MAGKEKRAKLFQTGRSQAVRLPKDFRFEGKEVRIRKVGGGVLLEAVEDDWEWLKKLQADIGGQLDPAFLSAVEEEVPQQERPELDKLFP
jgi:antitoxin VapB